MRYIVVVLMSLRIINCVWGKSTSTKTTDVDVVFIRNPIEADMPGHWLPADLLKKVMEVRGSYTPTRKVKRTTKKPAMSKSGKLKHTTISNHRGNSKSRTTSSKMYQNTNRPTTYTAKSAITMNKQSTFSINKNRATRTFSTHKFSLKSAKKSKETDKSEDDNNIKEEELKLSGNADVEVSTTKDRSNVKADKAIKKVEVITPKIIDIDTTKLPFTTQSLYTTQTIFAYKAPPTTQSQSMAQPLSTPRPPSTTQLLSITPLPTTKQSPSTTQLSSMTQSLSTTQQTTTSGVPTVTTKPTTTTTGVTTTSTASTTTKGSPKTTEEDEDSGDPFY